MLRVSMSLISDRIVRSSALTRWRHTMTAACIRSEQMIISRQKAMDIANMPHNIQKTAHLSHRMILLPLC